MCSAWCSLWVYGKAVGSFGWRSPYCWKRPPFPAFLINWSLSQARLPGYTLFLRWSWGLFSTHFWLYFYFCFSPKCCIGCSDVSSWWEGLLFTFFSSGWGGIGIDFSSSLPFYPCCGVVPDDDPAAPWGVNLCVAIVIVICSDRHRCFSPSSSSLSLWSTRLSLGWTSSSTASSLAPPPLPPSAPPSPSSSLTLTCTACRKCCHCSFNPSISSPRFIKKKTPPLKTGCL